jgi:hypothetical protein
LDLAIADGRAYAAIDNDTLQVFDISNPSDPKEINSYTTGPLITDIAAQGSDIYLGDYSDGLFILTQTKAYLPLLLRWP